jgi:chemotaxis protein methyltransferase CheR
MMTQPFIQLLEAHTGLKLLSQYRSVLEKTIQSRMKALKLSTPHQYYQHLLQSTNSENTNFIHLNPEWQYLIQQITTRESYFLRDQGQLQLLQQKILPELIHHRRQESFIHHTNPTLRIWSAGCSTGEEAYSLAILLHQLIPDLFNWNFLILGTDINAEVIEIAKKGVYSSWSFRAIQLTGITADCSLPTAPCPLLTAHC